MTYSTIKISLLSSVIVFVGMTIMSCNDATTAPEKNTSAITDTSKFIGTWVTVFDTSDTPPGTKEEKLEQWCPMNECMSPDTIDFINDSIVVGYKFGFDKFYFYSDDSIYYHLPIVGTNEKEFLESKAYYLSNDTLIFNPDPIEYSPICIRISKIPINKWNR